MPSKVCFNSLDANNPTGPPLSTVARSWRPPSPGKLPKAKSEGKFNEGGPGSGKKKESEYSDEDEEGYITHKKTGEREYVRE